jgi:hypothetical protein
LLFEFFPLIFFLSYDLSSQLNHIKTTLIRFNLKSELSKESSQESLNLTKLIMFNDNEKKSHCDWEILFLHHHGGGRILG